MKEIWDGKRFAELSWFWDPDKEWLLPVRCPMCSSVISAEEISKHISMDKNRYTAHILVICDTTVTYSLT